MKTPDYTQYYAGGSILDWCKNWILRRKFVSDLLAMAYRQGGVDSFPLAHKDIRETMRDDIEKMADERLKAKVAELLTIVDLNMVISFSPREKAVFLGGEKVTDPGHLQALKAEAEMLLASSLWHVLYETPKELAQKAMFVAGESVTDMQKGRTILYTLETQRKILDTLKSYSQPAIHTSPKPGV